MGEGESVGVGGRRIVKKKKSVDRINTRIPPRLRLIKTEETMMSTPIPRKNCLLLPGMDKKATSFVRKESCGFTFG